MNAGPATTHNVASTVWVGGLPPDMTDALLYELFINAGPITSVSLPRDKLSGAHNGFAFIEYATVADAEYAMRIFDRIKLHGVPIKLSRSLKADATNGAAADQFNAKLFVGKLAADVDDKTLQDTFAQFGPVLSARVMADADSGISRGFGFVTFETFAAADAAIAALNGQFISGQQITVDYALKKDGRHGERHGSDVERRLEDEANKRLNKAANIVRPPPQPPSATPQHTLPHMMPPMMMPPGMPYGYYPSYPPPYPYAPFAPMMPAMNANQFPMPNVYPPYAYHYPYQLPPTQTTANNDQQSTLTANTQEGVSDNVVPNT